MIDISSQLIFHFSISTTYKLDLTGVALISLFTFPHHPSPRSSVRGHAVPAPSRYPDRVNGGWAREDFEVHRQAVCQSERASPTIVMMHRRSRIAGGCQAGCESCADLSTMQETVLGATVPTAVATVLCSSRERSVRRLLVPRAGAHGSTRVAVSH
jgi:hypothetical protein